VNADARTLEELRRIAALAAVLVREAYDSDFRVDYKSADDPVTEVDRAANELLVSELARTFPGVPIVAEESDASTFDARLAGGPTFFVDPIDGTRDFIKKNGEFAVMIGLADGGRALLGIVDCPAWGKSFGGGVGVPSHVVDANGARSPIAPRNGTELARAAAFVSRSRGDDTRALLESLGVRDVRPRGGAGVKGIGVAAGEVDLYLQTGRSGSLWDACAPEAIAAGVGVRYTDPWGQAFDYRRSVIDLDRGVLAASPLLHDAMVAALAEIPRARGGTA
jgi:3'(2'), 5'-bisphosphate nucleotidase